jgi:hypothetical protein
MFTRKQPSLSSTIEKELSTPCSSNFFISRKVSTRRVSATWLGASPLGTGATGTADVDVAVLDGSAAQKRQHPEQDLASSNTSPRPIRACLSDAAHRSTTLDDMFPKLQVAQSVSWLLASQTGCSTRLHKVERRLISEERSACKTNP